MSPRGPVVVLLGLVTILMPFHTVIDVAADSGAEFRALGTAADIPLALLALAVPYAVLRGTRPRAARPFVIGLPLIGLMIVSLLVHPSWLGASLVIRLAGALAMATGMTILTRTERLLPIVLLVATAILQMAFAVAQVIAGGPLHLVGLGELQDPLQSFGTSLGPRGTMTHPYVLAGLGLIAAGAAVAMFMRSPRPVVWLIGTALSVSPVGLTYSRTALLGILGAGGTLVLDPRARSRRRAIAMVALLVGVLVPAVLESGGWFARAESTVERVPDRGILLAQAASVIAAAPLLGHGPGLYYDALDELERRAPGSVQVPQVPHSVPVLIAADAGVPAGLLVAALIVWLGWRAARAGAAATTAFALFLPFVLNEHFPYTYVQGAMLFGSWLGIVAALSAPDT